MHDRPWIAGLKRRLDDDRRSTMDDRRSTIDGPWPAGLAATSLVLQPANLRRQRPVEHRGRHRVRHRRQRRSLVQRGRVGRVKCAETGMWPNGATCGKPALGIVVRDVEPGTPVNIEPAMRAFAERQYDLIVGVGFAQAPILEYVAAGLPGHPFCDRRRRQRAARTWPRSCSRSTRVVPGRHPCRDDEQRRARWDSSAAWTSG